jgi:Holliday junction resolvasome RuvABC endonuclease subunit
MVSLSKFVNVPNTVMAIDASTNSLAFSIFENKALKQFGKINFIGNNTYEKVMDACKKTSSFMKLYSIDAIVIEHTVFMNSPKTAADLALVQGSLLGAAGVAGVNIIRSVAPITWQNFIGNKKFSTEEKLALRKQFPDKSDSWYKNQERQLRKEKTIRFISVQYDKIIKDNDVADAIAIGHYAINNWERLTK